MKRALSLILALVLCLSLCACGEDTPTVPNNTEPSTGVHAHTWKNATCDAPKTCETCGETEGEKLNHNWVRNTCTDPYTCSLCNATDGDGDKHYINSNGVCHVCKKPLEELEKEPGYQYQHALELLASWGSQNEDFKKAYQLLSVLGDYKDSADYLNRFTVISDTLLYWVGERVNVFGEIFNSTQRNFRYDSLGRITDAPEGEYYKGSSDIILYDYDDEGRLIQKGTTLYSYNDAGQLVETRVMNGESTFSLTKHFYNDANQEIRSEIVYEYGSETVTTYLYDETGNRIRMEEVHDGRDAIVTTYKYDSTGRIVSGKCGKIHWEYEYDSDGRLVLYTYTSSEHYFKSETSYVYDGDRLISVKYTEESFGQEVVYVTNYTYGDYYCYTPAE